MKKIQDQHIQGLTVQLELAFYNRNMLLELKKVKPSFHNFPNHFKLLFNYLVTASKEKMILTIAKIYDRNSNKQTRRIEKLINQIQSNNLVIKSDLHEYQWAGFIRKYTDFELHDYTYLNFIQWANAKLIEWKNDDTSSLRRIKNWRDKQLTHNENYDLSILKLENKEISELLLFAEVVLDFTNTFASTGTYGILKKENPYFINEIFKEYL